MAKEHEFGVIAVGRFDLSFNFVDRLYAAGLDDCLLSTVDGILHIDVCREAPSREDAVESVRRQLTTVGISIDSIVDL